MSRTVLTMLSAALLLGASFAPATSQADWHYHNGYEFRFHRPVDYHYWHRGGWRHEWHDGRLGWWWVVAGSWYFFNRPVYPYPSSDVPPVIIQEPQVTVVSPPATPPVYTPPPAPVATTASPYWYYCRSTNSYYPYVTSCTEGWTQVAAAPATP